MIDYSLSMRNMPNCSAAIVGLLVICWLFSLCQVVKAQPAAQETLQKALAESRQLSLKSLGEISRKKIEKGEVAARLEDIPESPVKIGIGIGIIPYPPEVIWQALNDYDNYQDFMPFTGESKVDLSRSRGDVVYFYSKLSFPLISDRYYSLKITSEENVEGVPGTFFISWSLDPEKESNLYLNSGSWKLLPYGDSGQKTLAFYTVVTDPGGSIPDFLKNKSTATGIPSVFKAISNRVREGLSAGIYRLPLPEDKLDMFLRKEVAETRSLNPSDLEKLSQEEKSALVNGEVLISMAEVKGSRVKIARAMALIETSPSRLWEIITAYEQYADFMPYVAESRIDPERSKGNATFLSYRLHFRIYPYIRDRYFTLKLMQEENPAGQPGSYFLHWWLDPTSPSNINSSCGSWKLIPHSMDGSQTLVFYTIFTDPGGSSPWFWKNISAKKAVRNVFEAIKNSNR